MLQIQLRRIIFFLLALALLTWQNQVFAQAKPAGLVVTTAGASASQPGAAARSLKRGSPFYSGDTLTNGAGQTQIRFTDGTIVLLRPQSVMRIDDYAYSLSSDDKGIKIGAMKYAVSLLAGGFRTITGAIGKFNPSDYNVTTNVATIGVRGTDYSIAYNKQSKTCGLAAALQQGTIAIKNAGGILVLGKSEKFQYACVESSFVAPEGVSTRPAIFMTDPKTLSSSSSRTGICLQ